jgi:hypothetical protein
MLKDPSRSANEGGKRRVWRAEPFVEIDNPVAAMVVEHRPECRGTAHGYISGRSRGTSERRGDKNWNDCAPMRCFVVFAKIPRVGSDLVKLWGINHGAALELEDDDRVSGEENDVRAASAFERKLKFEDHIPFVDLQRPEGTAQRVVFAAPRIRLAGARRLSGKCHAMGSELRFPFIAA